MFTALSLAWLFVYQVYAVMTETRRRCGILWNGSRRWLIGATWVLGAQPGFSAKAERAFNCWAISPTSGTQYFKNLTDSDFFFFCYKWIFCRFCRGLGQRITLRGILSSPVCVIVWTCERNLSFLCYHCNWKRDQGEQREREIEGIK